MNNFVNAILGKETIDFYTTQDTRGSQPTYGINCQKAAHDLMSMDELAVMDGGKCIVQIRGVRPFFSKKYDVTKHPLYKETGEYDERNKLDIQRFLHQTLKVRSGEFFDVIKI